MSLEVKNCCLTANTLKQKARVCVRHHRCTDQILSCQLKRHVIINCHDIVWFGWFAALGDGRHGSKSKSIDNHSFWCRTQLSSFFWEKDYYNNFWFKFVVVEESICVSSKLFLESLNTNWQRIFDKEQETCTNDASCYWNIICLNNVFWLGLNYPF